MSYTINLTNTQANQIIEKYKDYTQPHTNNYTLFRVKYKTATLTIFKTLTMLIQGSGSEELYLEICDLLKLEKPEETKVNSTESVNLSIIGTDEVGTGDFFGPVVVAGTYVPINKIVFLMKLGVKDSKQLTDAKILEIAPAIMKEIKHSALILDNIKFNYLTKVQQFNLNKIKALLHNNVIYNLIPKVEQYDKIVIDAFTTKDKYFEYLKDQERIVESVELEEKAESKYIAVAAASIIARYLFLLQFDKLSKEVGFDLPKGAGPKVDLAIAKIIKDKTERYLERIGKTNFKNIDKAKKKDNH